MTIHKWSEIGKCKVPGGFGILCATMQTMREIRELLTMTGLRPRRALGQNFLIDRNLMNKLLELAALGGGETVLEVGAATGSLTEELLERAARVVAVELDRGLLEIISARLGGREKLTLIGGDVLAGKHEISPQVLAALGNRACMVANLPYNVATPLVAECLLASWRAARGRGGAIFDRLTFTVQEEVARRLAAPPGGRDYGSVSVLVSLLGVLGLASAVPASAFWPRPKVASRMVRIDFDEAAAGRLADADALQDLLAAAFAHRRKQIGFILRQSDVPLPADALAAGMAAAGIDRTRRPQEISPQQYLVWSNILAGKQRPG